MEGVRVLVGETVRLPIDVRGARATIYLDCVVGGCWFFGFDTGAPGWGNVSRTVSEDKSFPSRHHAIDAAVLEMIRCWRIREVALMENALTQLFDSWEWA